MEKTRIQWCPSRWRTSPDTSTSSRPAARKRSEVIDVFASSSTNDLSVDQCVFFMRFWIIIKSRLYRLHSCVPHTFPMHNMWMFAVLFCAGGQVGGGVQGRAAASLWALSKWVRSLKCAFCHSVNSAVSVCLSWFFFNLPSRIKIKPVRWVDSDVFLLIFSVQSPLWPSGNTALLPNNWNDKEITSVAIRNLKPVF